MKNKIPSLFQLIFWLILNFLGWLLLGCLASLITAILIFAIWGASGTIWLQDIMQQSYQYLLQTPEHTFMGSIDGWLQAFDRWLAAIENYTSSFYKEVGFSNIHVQSYAKIILTPYVKATILGIKLLIIRLYFFSHWGQLFLILGMVGMVDGMTQRNIRRANVGRESALIYHQAKALIMLSVILGIFVDLVLPIKINQAQWILVLAAVLFAIAIQITAKSFKKYL